MPHARAVGIGSVIVLVAVMLAAGLTLSGANQVVTPRADQVRFQLIGTEPIAAPDGRALVTGWSVQVFKDRTTGACYAAFERGAAISAVAMNACP